MNPRLALDWSLAAVAFAAPLSIAGANVGLAVVTITAAWLWAVEPDRRAAMRAPLDSPAFKLLVAGALWALVSAAAGIDPNKGLRAWPKDLHKLWAFAALAAGLASARREKALAALGLGLGAAALVGTGQTLFQSGGDAGFVRARGFVHAVVFGEIVGLGLLGAAAHLATGASKGRTAAAALATALSVAVIFNQTRAVLLALFASALFTAFNVPRLRRRALSVMLALAAVAVVWEFMPTGGRNLRTLLARAPEVSGAHRARFILWEAALQMARERPVTGVGLGSYRRAFEERFDTSALDKERVWGSAHNLFLHQLAERGVPGLLLLFALFAAFIASARQAWKERGDAAALATLVAAAAFVVMNMTESAWQTEQTATFFLLIWLWGVVPEA